MINWALFTHQPLSPSVQEIVLETVGGLGGGGSPPSQGSQTQTAQPCFLQPLLLQVSFQ